MFVCCYIVDNASVFHIKPGISLDIGLHDTFKI